MSTILGADGKPVEKKWEEMDLDEKLNVLRLGIGALIQQGNALGAGLQRIITAMDEMDANGTGEPEVHNHLDTHESHCGMTPAATAVPNEPPYLQP